MTRFSWWQQKSRFTVVCEFWRELLQLPLVSLITVVYFNIHFISNIKILISYSKQGSWNNTFAPLPPLRAGQHRCVICSSSQCLMGNLPQRTGWMWTDTGQSDNLNRYISFDINMAFLVGPANSDVQFRDSSSWQYENGIFIWAGELALWMYGKCSGFWLRNRRLGSALSSPSMSNMSECRSPFWMTVIFLILFDIYWYES